jgi:hypothetical protein
VLLEPELLLPDDELPLDDGVFGVDGVLGADGVDGVLGVGGGVGGGVDGGGVDGGGVDGGIGQLALVSITDPSGHVFVVAAGGGVNVWVHDGSVGFFVQSTGGGVPVVQLSVHVDLVPFPPDVVVDVVFGGIAADVLADDGADDVVVLTFGHVVLSLHVDGGGVGVIPCSFASCMSQSLVLRFLSGSVMALLSARSHFGGGGGVFGTHLSMPLIKIGC